MCCLVLDDSWQREQEPEKKESYQESEKPVQKTNILPVFWIQEEWNHESLRR